MRSEYPELLNSGIEEVIERIVELRFEDLTDWNNLPQRFVGGRKTNRIPSSSVDVLASDLEGDIAVDGPNNFLYILVDNAGTLVWRRITLAAF